MSIHHEILATAQRICASRGEWTFTPVEIVDALPHLNARSVRTHITSRCCVNAPANHPHRLPYFLRVSRGIYEILPSYRDAAQTVPDAGQSRSAENEVRESPAEYITFLPRIGARVRAATSPPVGQDSRTSIHAVVSESEGKYVAECLEVAVVTQGRSLDETLANLREALALYLDGDDADEADQPNEPKRPNERVTRLGLAPTPRLMVSFETWALAP